MSLFDSLDFSICDQAMRRTAIPFSPAEAHGIAVGLGGGVVADPQAQWHAVVYADLDPNDALAAEARNLLDELFDAAQQQLQDESFGLQLFLPDEAHEQADALPLSAALRDWARGYLYGVGLSGSGLEQSLSAEGREALQDLYEISHLDVDDEPLSEEDQQAATELEEYMRVAAMLIHEELRGGQGAPASELMGEGGYEHH